MPISAAPPRGPIQSCNGCNATAPPVLDMVLLGTLGVTVRVLAGTVVPGMVVPGNVVASCVLTTDMVLEPTMTVLMVSAGMTRAEIVVGSTVVPGIVVV